MRRWIGGALFGFALGCAFCIYIDWTHEVQAGAVEELLTLRIPTIPSDSTFTPQQRAALVVMFGDLVTQQETINRGFSERLRNTLISGRTYHGSAHSN